MMDLSELRLSPQDDALLCWFFDTAHGELGLRAQSYEPTTRGTATDGHNAALERQMEAAEKYRRINATLDRMPRWAVRVLQRWCAPGRWARDLQAEYDRHACLVSLTPTGRRLGAEVIASMCRRAASAPFGDHARGIVSTVRGEAVRLLALAAKEYGMARPTGKPATRAEVRQEALRRLSQGGAAR